MCHIESWNPHWHPSLRKIMRCAHDLKPPHYLVTHSVEASSRVTVFDAAHIVCPAMAGCPALRPSTAPRACIQKCTSCLERFAYIPAAKLRSTNTSIDWLDPDRNPQNDYGNCPHDTVGPICQWRRHSASSAKMPGISKWCLPLAVDQYQSKPAHENTSQPIVLVYVRGYTIALM